VGIDGESHDRIVFNDEYTLVLCMWIRHFAYFHTYTNIPGPLHHRHPLRSYSTSQTFRGLQYINIPMIQMSCRHVRHLQRFYYVFTHCAPLHLQIFDTSYPHTTTHLKILHRHAYKYPITSSKLQVHHPTSLNILPFQSTLTPNIRYYSHTPYRLLIGSSKTFGYSPFHFLSTPDALVHISEDFYCARTHTGMHSGIYPLPSLRPLCLHLLKFSITFGSVAKHSHH